MVVVNSLKPDWPVEYIVYTATLPMSLTGIIIIFYRESSYVYKFSVLGADVAIFAAAFTYLVDISSNEYRTIRVTILEVCYLATMPIGIALGSIIYRYFYLKL